MIVKSKHASCSLWSYQAGWIMLDNRILYGTFCRSREKTSTNDTEERKGKMEGSEPREIRRATQH